MQLNIIKFGGSIITGEGFNGFFNKKNTYCLAKELFPHYRGCILIHGTGLIGKPPAIKHGYVKHGIIPKNKSLIALRIRNELRQLNQKVVATLLSAAIPAMPLDSTLYINEAMDKLYHESLRYHLINIIQSGYVPIFYGDLMPKSDGSFQVLSSDVIACILAKELRPDNALFLTDVDGIYPHDCMENKDCGGEILTTLSHDNVDLIRQSASDENDVSGGMSKKASYTLAIARYAKRCIIANGLKEGVLSRLLKGETGIGTRIII